MAMARPNSDDRMERIEWQLNQIRINTLVVGLFFGLALVGAFAAVLFSS